AAVPYPAAAPMGSQAAPYPAPAPAQGQADLAGGLSLDLEEDDEDNVRTVMREMPKGVLADIIAHASAVPDARAQAAGGAVPPSQPEPPPAAAAPTAPAIGAPAALFHDGDPAEPITRPGLAVSPAAGPPAPRPAAGKPPPRPQIKTQAMPVMAAA